MLAAWASVNKPQILRHARAWLGVGIAGIAMMVWAAAARGDFLVRLDTPYLFFHHSLVAAAFAAVVFGTTGRSRLGECLFANAPLRFLGLISYSLYLWHYPLLLWFRSMGCFDGNLGPAGLIILFCAVPLILFAAWASYYFVERPFQRETAPVQNNIAMDSPP